MFLCYILAVGSLIGIMANVGKLEMKNSALIFYKDHEKAAQGMVMLAIVAGIIVTGIFVGVAVGIVVGIVAFLAWGYILDVVKRANDQNVASTGIAALTQHPVANKVANVPGVQPQPSAIDPSSPKASQ